MLLYAVVVLATIPYSDGKLIPLQVTMNGDPEVLQPILHSLLNFSPFNNQLRKVRKEQGNPNHIGHGKKIPLHTKVQQWEQQDRPQFTEFPDFLSIIEKLADFPPRGMPVLHPRRRASSSWISETPGDSHEFYGSSESYFGYGHNKQQPPRRPKHPQPPISSSSSSSSSNWEEIFLPRVILSRQEAEPNKKNIPNAYVSPSRQLLSTGPESDIRFFLPFLQLLEPATPGGDASAANWQQNNDLPNIFTRPPPPLPSQPREPPSWKSRTNQNLPAVLWPQKTAENQPNDHPFLPISNDYKSVESNIYIGNPGNRIDIDVNNTVANLEPGSNGKEPEIDIYLPVSPLQSQWKKEIVNTPVDSKKSTKEPEIDIYVPISRPESTSERARDLSLVDNRKKVKEEKEKFVSFVAEPGETIDIAVEGDEVLMRRRVPPSRSRPLNRKPKGIKQEKAKETEVQPTQQSATSKAKDTGEKQKQSEEDFTPSLLLNLLGLLQGELVQASPKKQLGKADEKKPDKDEFWPSWEIFDTVKKSPTNKQQVAKADKKKPDKDEFWPSLEVFDSVEKSPAVPFPFPGFDPLGFIKKDQSTPSSGSGPTPNQLGLDIFDRTPKHKTTQAIVATTTVTPTTTTRALHREFKEMVFSHEQPEEMSNEEGVEETAKMNNPQLEIDDILNRIMSMLNGNSEDQGKDNNGSIKVITKTSYFLVRPRMNSFDEATPVDSFKTLLNHDESRQQHRGGGLPKRSNRKKKKRVFSLLNNNMGNDYRDEPEEREKPVELKSRPRRQRPLKNAPWKRKIQRDGARRKSLEIKKSEESNSDDKMNTYGNMAKATSLPVNNIVKTDLKKDTTRDYSSINTAKSNADEPKPEEKSTKMLQAGTQAPSTTTTAATDKTRTESTFSLVTKNNGTNEDETAHTF